MKINHKPMFDYLVVGAGFAGAVIAERLASQAGKKVLIIDKRNHIGGNTYDYYNNEGYLYTYTAHIYFIQTLKRSMITSENSQHGVLMSIGY
jgi:UDP-galactopyranose mutase